MKKFTIILYGIFLLLFSIFSYLFIDPNLIYFHKLYSGFAYSYRSATTIAFVFFIFLSFLFYTIFLSMSKKKSFLMKDIKLLIAISVGILIFSYPAMLSYDIFNYITTAKVLYAHHENPYIVMPVEFTSDPYLLFTRAANKTALYGPVWIGMTAIPYFLSFGNFFLLLFNFKLFTVFFYLLLVFLIWKITKNQYSIVFFALNPLILIETIVSGHNDVVMMFFALLSLLLIMKKKIWQAAGVFVLSIGIKYATIFLLPVVFYLLFSQRNIVNKQKIFLYAGIAMIVVFLLSPVREEMYPWYAIWFLTFVSLLSNKSAHLFSIAVSFGLLLRYVPYMFFGTYFGPTPMIKIVVTITPLFFAFCYFFLRSELWRRRFIH